MITNQPGSTASTSFTIGNGDPNENNVAGNARDKFFDRSENLLYICISPNTWAVVEAAIDTEDMT